MSQKNKNKNKNQKQNKKPSPLFKSFLLGELSQQQTLTQSLNTVVLLTNTAAVRVTGVTITQEAKTGESFEPRSSEPIWTV